jgi:DNA-binding NarL/FixJ family response regulator
MTPADTKQRGTALVADDHSLYRAGLGLLLKDRLGFQSVLEASSFDAALDRLADTPNIEMALFDLSMPGVGGPHSLGIVREIYPSIRVAVVSASEERTDVLASVATGLGGYVPKSLLDDEMVIALQGILDGRIYVPQFMTVESRSASVPASASGETEPLQTKSGLAAKAATKPMSPRQRDVLAGVRRGLSNKEIARELDIAEGTVKIHLAALFSNFGVRNRTELATKPLLSAQLPSSSR